MPINGQNDGSEDLAHFLPCANTGDDAGLIEVDALIPVNDGPARIIHITHQAPPTGFLSICGRRKDMEDALCVAHNFPSLLSPSLPSDLHFFAVYDGHGGAQVAMHCREHLHIALAEEMQKNGFFSSIEDTELWEKSLKATFLRMDGEVRDRSSTGAGQNGSIANMFPDTVGSTAVVAVLSFRHIVVANCGDSRAVLCRNGQAIPLSVDHKPDREDEMARIEAAGGKVICWNGWRVLGVLAMSRAIGDHFLEPYIIAEPEVTMLRRSHKDECLILASDGLWDVISNRDACLIARRCLAAKKDAQFAATALVQEAHEKGSSDNISVVVIDLRHGATGTIR